MRQTAQRMPQAVNPYQSPYWLKMPFNEERTNQISKISVPLQTIIRIIS